MPVPRLLRALVGEFVGLAYDLTLGWWKVPYRYHLRSLFVRRAATLLTVVAIGFTVFILILVLSLAKGFELSLAEAGREDNVIFLREAAMSEGVSVLARDQARLLADRPEIARDPADGAPLASREFYAGIHLEKVTGGGTNISIRGTTAKGLALRSGARISEGRMFRPGTEEVVVGRGLLDRVKGCTPGGVIDFQVRRMPVVGVLDSQGGVFDSEIWGDVEVMQQVFMRESYSTVIARVETPEGMESLRALVKDNPTLPLKVLTERTYFRQQSGFLGAFLKAMAYFLASIMAVGAVFGSTNTLLASLAGRSREIGTLLAMGYRPMVIRQGFLVEALVLGVLGGLCGVLFALPINGLATGTTNWNTFTEQTFAFAVTPDVMIQAVIFAGFIGVVGGVLPAFRAASLPPTEALRA
jgi:ABC-type antimicrobial peptide transport system permease subunit